MNEVLECYYKPFDSAIHALIRFTNIRLKANSIFEQAGIGIIPESKFALKIGLVDINDDIRAKTADEQIRERGFKDYAKNPIFYNIFILFLENFTVYYAKKYIFIITVNISYLNIL